MEKRYKEEDEAFYRRMILPVEKYLHYGLIKPPGTFRWFQSPNIIPIEHYRRAAETKSKPPKAA